MRAFFWIVTILGLLLTLAGLLLFDSPVIRDVVGSVLDEWYLGHIVQAAVVGAIVGGIGGVWVRRSLRFEPHQPGWEYLNRAAFWGFIAHVMTCVLVLLLFYLSATKASFIPLKPWDRFVVVLLAAKSLGVLGSGLISAGVIYATATRFQLWGGRYALLRHNMIPNLTRMA